MSCPWAPAGSRLYVVGPERPLQLRLGSLARCRRARTRSCAPVFIGAGDRRSWRQCRRRAGTRSIPWRRTEVATLRWLPVYDDAVVGTPACRADVCVRACKRRRHAGSVVSGVDDPARTLGEERAGPGRGAHPAGRGGGRADTSGSPAPGARVVRAASESTVRVLLCGHKPCAHESTASRGAPARRGSRWPPACAQRSGGVASYRRASFGNRSQ